MKNVFRDFRGVEREVDQCVCGGTTVRVEFNEHKYLTAFVESGVISSSLVSHLTEIKDFIFHCVRCGAKLESKRRKKRVVEVLNRLGVVFND